MTTEVVRAPHGRPDREPMEPMTAATVRQYVAGAEERSHSRARKDRIQLPKAGIKIRICRKYVDIVNFLHHRLRDETKGPISIISKSVWGMKPHGVDTGKQLSHEYSLIFSLSLTSRG